MQDGILYKNQQSRLCKMRTIDGLFDAARSFFEFSMQNKRQSKRAYVFGVIFYFIRGIHIDKMTFAVYND